MGQIVCGIRRKGYYGKHRDQLEALGFVFGKLRNRSCWKKNIPLKSPDSAPKPRSADVSTGAGTGIGTGGDAKASGGAGVGVSKSGSSSAAAATATATATAGGVKGSGSGFAGISYLW